MRANTPPAAEPRCGQGRSQQRAPGDAAPRHTHRRRRRGGRPGPARRPRSSRECFPPWPARSPGKGPQKCGGSHLGKSWNWLFPARPAGGLPTRDTVAEPGGRRAPGHLPGAPPRAAFRGPRSASAAVRLPAQEPGSPAARPLICAVRAARLKAGRPVPAESAADPGGGLFLSYRRRNAAAAAAAAAWAVGRQGSPEGAPSPLRSSRSVRAPSRTRRGELEGKKGRKGKERERERESARSRRAHPDGRGRSCRRGAQSHEKQTF